ncbi:hypothetical protein Ctha_1187 [Chloroherpeton thalassium ATCC 35110]|uniref:DUF4178 domain-containing protein n=1 Tax=Chloroherpeton thalassium (strain ATCC 35110 / GB-78) TaxID=517418 RepID=B3QYM3_CHLT3|nr:DUF4178 domain-containing protein [Chloroherpeton thalassium]ACF13651.1 hypothetical protein Ctha_1187 [Chloroherpeton thalassium ATCC 35110]
MPFNFFFKKKDSEESFDPLKDLVLSKLKVGYILDYDMKTWVVSDYNKYNIDGHVSHEWELTSGREKIYLEREEDDDVFWSVCKKLPIGAIDGGIKKYIMENDDPPEQITVKENKYYMDESGAGFMYKGGLGRGIEFIFWTFVDADDKGFITIEQWGESEFDAVEGIFVEEYQFSNILPGQTKSS